MACRGAGRVSQSSHRLRKTSDLDQFMGGAGCACAWTRSCSNASRFSWYSCICGSTSDALLAEDFALQSTYDYKYRPWANKFFRAHRQGAHPPRALFSGLTPALVLLTSLSWPLHSRHVSNSTYRRSIACLI